MRSAGKSRKTTAALAVAVAGLLLGTSTVASGAAAGAATEAVAPLSGFKGPRGVDLGPEGRLLVSQTNGTYGAVIRKGDLRGTFVRLGRVPRTFVAPAIDMNRRKELFVLTPAGEPGIHGLASLYRWNREEGEVKIANIRRYQRQDRDPFDLEERPGESNPYGVAALNDGTALVADAAGNDLLRVRPHGKIYTVARFKPRVVRVPEGLDPELPEKMPAESVPTSVTVGADGAYYVGELRGFPGTVGTSAIWRINPKARNAVCNPATPKQGPCKLYAGGFTSIVGLARGRGGSIFVAELSKQGWLAIEDPNAPPEAFIGSVIRVGHDTDVRHELKPGRTTLPGDLAVGREGAVFVTTPIFGRGMIKRVD